MPDLLVEVVDAHSAGQARDVAAAVECTREVLQLSVDFHPFARLEDRQGFRQGVVVAELPDVADEANLVHDQWGPQPKPVLRSMELGPRDRLSPGGLAPFGQILVKISKIVFTRANASFNNRMIDFRPIGSP